MAKMIQGICVPTGNNPSEAWNNFKQLPEYSTTKEYMITFCSDINQYVIYEVVGNIE